MAVARQRLATWILVKPVLRYQMGGGLSLHTRISLVLTALAAGLLFVLAALWIHGTRAAINEEIEAAARVSEQWLVALGIELRKGAEESLATRTLAAIQPLGRIRANGVEIQDRQGALIYRSPAPTYKAGRAAPEWFSGLLSADFAPRWVAIGDLNVVIRPDASRAVLDAWDDVTGMVGWALGVLAILFLGVRVALAKALRPLDMVMAALDRTGRGQFDTRLPVFEVPELGSLSRAFNGMADRLAHAVDENVCLEAEREVARRMQGSLEADRRAVARELHDELAQGITAVRALAGAIAQRTEAQPDVQGYAGNIVSVTGQMQDGIRTILHRLRKPAAEPLLASLERNLAAWRQQHPEIELEGVYELGDAPLSDELAGCALRIVQEGLTNVVRHAQARHVEVRVWRRSGDLEIVVADDGVGLGGEPSAQAGSGLGLTGMVERVELLGGELRLETPVAGGCRLVARIPEDFPAPVLEEKL